MLFLMPFDAFDRAFLNHGTDTSRSWMDLFRHRMGIPLLNLGMADTFHKYGRLAASKDSQSENILVKKSNVVT